MSDITPSLSNNGMNIFYWVSTVQYLYSNTLTNSYLPTRRIHLFALFCTFFNDAYADVSNIHSCIYIHLSKEQFEALESHDLSSKVYKVHVGLSTVDNSV